MEYQERDFNAALNDAQNPDLLSYEYFVESHGLKIYRSYKQVSIKIIAKVIICFTKKFFKVWSYIGIFTRTGSSILPELMCNRAILLRQSK